MKKKVMLFFVCAFVFLMFGFAFGYEAVYGPTELTYYDRAKAFNGYTLFKPESGAFTYLINMEGKVVHKWPGTLNNPQLLDNGNLFGSFSRDVYIGLAEMDWNGKIVWEYLEKRENYHIHHDHLRIFNKKLNVYTNLYIANIDLTHEQLIAAGADPNAVKTYNGTQMDAIVEVDMNGKVVWEWWFFNHLVQDIDSTKANYGQVAANPGKLDLNYGRPPQVDWNHNNALDYHEELDMIVTSSNRMHEIYVIDHGNTFIPGDLEGSKKLAAGPKGDFVYRFGNPAIYGQGRYPQVEKDPYYISDGHMQIGGVHSVHWIKKGLPGSGNLLLFNNGTRIYMETPQSSAMEINPYLDIKKQNTGKFVNPPDAGYWVRKGQQMGAGKPTRLISNQIVWNFETKSPQSFTSLMNGSAYRMPNGNTVICSSSFGHFFEVTPKGEVVWEYINPITLDGVLKVIGDCPQMYNRAFRIYRYAPDHPGLKGKDLTPQGTITELYAAGKLPEEAPKKKQK